jgi:hypothetical protein
VRLEEALLRLCWCLLTGRMMGRIGRPRGSRKVGPWLPLSTGWGCIGQGILEFPGWGSPLPQHLRGQRAHRRARHSDLCIINCHRAPSFRLSSLVRYYLCDRTFHDLCRPEPSMNWRGSLQASLELGSPFSFLWSFFSGCLYQSAFFPPRNQLTTAPVSNSILNNGH